MVVPIIVAEGGISLMELAAGASFVQSVVYFAEQHPELTAKATRTAWLLFLLSSPFGVWIWLLSKDKHHGRRNYEVIQNRFYRTWKATKEHRTYRPYHPRIVMVPQRPLSEEIGATIPPVQNLEHLLNVRAEQEARRLEKRKMLEAK
jgi:hypothetical protein